MSRRAFAPAVLATVVVAALLAVLVPLWPADAQEPPSRQLVIDVLSNRADLISGGDALVEVVLPPEADPGDVRVTVGGRDVTGAFEVKSQGRFIGLVTGLHEGTNILRATLPSGYGARIEITNHPIGGPVFSGPQVQPWNCDDGALDEQCNREPTYSFSYISTNPSASGFQSYDPEDPPDDVATTTTDQGNEVPFIVRLERGVNMRDNYAIAALYDPSQGWDPADPQPGYNGKVVAFHGASCDTVYGQGSAPGVLNEEILGLGFITYSHAANNSGHNCNAVTQAEAMIATKERIVEQYGEIRYQIGNGCSGGALAQYWMANAYPGLYQGITVGCSFMDAWSSAMQYIDYYHLRQYFESEQSVADGILPAQWPAIYGHPNPANAITFTEVIPNSGNPARDCPEVPADQEYDPDSNPDGLRCTLQDWWVNVLGRDDAGYARRPIGNEGIQYGLLALYDATLLPEQFIALNAHLGGLDQDLRVVPERVPADPIGVERIYRAGGNNTASNLDQVAIIDYRGPDPGAFHDTYRTYAIRDRIVREHGHADNMLIWRGSVALVGDVSYATDAILAMDRWLAAAEADTRDVPFAQKVVEDRPEDVTDRCTDGAGQDVPMAYCDAIVDVYSTPRMAAGMPSTDDVLTCELVPVRDYAYEVELSDAQLDALEGVFPTGVCDWSQPDPNFSPTVGWQHYDVVGGAPLGPEPVSVAFGPGEPVRYAGPTRIHTAIAISRAQHDAADTVVLATAGEFADALAGAPLAVQLGAPILLSGHGALDAATAAEIVRLGATRAVLLGGDHALSPQVAADLDALGLSVERVAGTNRYGTSAAILGRLAAADDVYVVTGEDFTDALVTSALAAALGRPVLLTADAQLPPEVADVLHGDMAAVIVGDAVAADVVQAVDAQAGDVRRVEGGDPYATSVAVAEEAAAAGVDPAVTWIATATRFPDGLVAGAAAGHDGGILLLVHGDDASAADPTYDYVAAHVDAIGQVKIAGGARAVSGAVEQRLLGALGTAAR